MTAPWDWIRIADEQQAEAERLIDAGHRDGVGSDEGRAAVAALLAIHATLRAIELRLAGPPRKP